MKINIDKLNPMLKKEFIDLESECIELRREEGYSYYDITCYLNDYIYSLSDCVNSYFLKAVYELEEHYHSRYVERELAD